MNDKVWHFDFYQQWAEIAVIILTTEYSDDLRPSGYFELHVGLLGFGFTVTRIPPGMQELIDKMPATETETDDG